MFLEIRNFLLIIKDKFGQYYYDRKYIETYKTIKKGNSITLILDKKYIRPHLWKKVD